MGVVQPCALGHFSLLFHHWANSPLLSHHDGDDDDDDDDDGGDDYGDRDRAGFNDMKMLWKLIQRDHLLVLQLPFDALQIKSCPVSVNSILCIADQSTLPDFSTHKYGFTDIHTNQKMPGQQISKTDIEFSTVICHCVSGLL